MSVGAVGSPAGLPPINAALEPAEIRNGDANAKQAYQEALAFEDILVQQLTDEVASTVTGPDSDTATAGFARMIPTALTQGIMSGGGLGIAAQLAHSIDPAIGASQANADDTRGKDRS